MKTLPVLLLFATSLAAHDLATTDREVLRAHILEEWKRERGMTEVASTASVVQLAAAAAANAANAPQTAKAFLPFTKLDLRADGEFLYVGSNGLPDHNMMVGITAWQQQVPLPQPYFDDNAWRIPLKPVVAKEPAMIKGRFLRGAIALAVNGIPIFNPQNNRGEISYEIGELDEWGGHCGRADDYHYHIAPLHLQAQVGKGMPVAYALDGYPVYGLTEPDGSPVANLDVCHGHDDAKIGYHYHASNQYPYVFGGFHGEVVEAGEQVDPQPRAQGVREALTALRGAKITAFESTGKDSYKLSYEVNGDKRSVSYSIKADGTYPFHFDNGRDGTADEVYTARRQGGGGGGDRPPGGGPEGMKGKGKGKGHGKGGREGEMRRDDPPPPRPGEEGGRPPRPQAAIEGILDVNGDGVVTAQEFADNAKSNAAKKGIAITDALAKAKEQFTALDHNRDGKLDTPELDELAGNAPAPDAPQPRGEEPPAREEMKKGGGGERGGKGQSFVALPDQPRSSDGKFMLNSPVVEDLQALPTEFTGDGDGISPPLAWSGAPAGTKGYALIMDHVTPDGDRKWYWTVYDIPGSASSLPKNVTDIGKLGTGFKGEIGYEPPHSKGPGAKTYVITLYALSEPLKVAGKPGREELITAMKGKVLANSSLRVVHSSGGAAKSDAGFSLQERSQTQPRQEASGQAKALPHSEMAQNTVRPPEPPPQGPAGDRPKGPGGGGEPKKGGGKGKGKEGPPGLVKPSIADTIKLNVYADNWFMLYVNGRLVAVDSIQFTPHNVVSVDFLPEYPMTIAVLAKDNADPKTGMEYGTSIGDAGLCIKFADGTVTNASWKAKNFFHGPVNSDTANPKVIQEPLPANWWAIDFDDSTWKNAKEYTVEEVDPKQPYFDNDFEGAKFIWTDDIALDNTVIFRTKVEKTGWTPRWNTKPDLDVTGAPLK
ncbi:MAG: YHYH protein [Prosthecobacter sp.]|uniref:YHYH protein n=1 Tax=Prosthecobacter sp. TaxID=1965333 RepID=UPI0019FF4E0F|nr:YHYH protein [Prosthecobacter sp.]MBE2281986.1 YHYH protein [Prosthecobacter sp.]